MSSDNRKQKVEVELGHEILGIIESLYKQRDKQSLKLLHNILVVLIMNDIQDSTTSLIDLAEYCESLILALDGS